MTKTPVTMKPGEGSTPGQAQISAWGGPGGGETPGRVQGALPLLRLA